MVYEKNKNNGGQSSKTSYHSSFAIMQHRRFNLYSSVTLEWNKGR